MILVAGATGVLGGLICRRLRERGTPVRALTSVQDYAAGIARSMRAWALTGGER